MHRFYLPQSFSKQSELILSQKDEIHHLKNVLRLQSNDSIHIFNGRGVTASATIVNITEQEVRLRIEDVQMNAKNLPAIILACAIPKKGKFETIIEKTTELGIDEIFPLITQNSDVTYTKDKAIQKRQRFEKVAINASKQSKRSTIPIVHPVSSFQTAMDLLIPKTTVVIPSLTNNTQPLLKSLAKLNSPSVISIFIGPEGDFSEQEYQNIHAAGGIPVTLGDTTLKVETAAITAVGATQLYFID